jgi:hypothetical protein
MPDEKSDYSRQDHWRLLRRIYGYLFKICINRRFHLICAPLRVLQSQSRTKNKFGATFHQRTGANSIN